MPAIEVIEAVAATIQGLGRYGAQRYGIAPGGAMDRMALAEANALAGEPSGAAAIEIGPLPARFRVTGGPVRVALAGAGREVTADGRALGMGTTARLDEGCVLGVRGAADGQFTYLAVEGGLRGPSGDPMPALAGRDRFAQLRAWMLRPGDSIAVPAAVDGAPERRLRLGQRSAIPIRVVLGPQLDYFTPQAIAGFLAAPWRLSHAANRMAYLLEGARVELAKGHNIVSDGTVTGNIQIAGNGQPFVILCDRGTVGGYPKIATIITADLGRFAQTPLGGPVRFEAISVLEAGVLARDHATRLQNVKPRVERLSPADAGPGPEVTADALLSSNVAGEAFDALAWASIAADVRPADGPPSHG